MIYLLQLDAFVDTKGGEMWRSIARGLLSGDSSAANGASV